MPDTHCLPTGSLGTGELPIPSISVNNVFTLAPSPGSRRGIVVFLHGLGTGANSSPPSAILDHPGGFLPSLVLTFCNDLVADGWVVFCPSNPEDDYTSTGAAGIFNDVNNDAGHGARYLSNVVNRWWDHVLQYIHTTYGNHPVVAFGFSWGGWTAIQIAANRQSSIIAYGAHCPVTILSNISQSYTGFVNFASTNTTGLDATATQLNAVTIPGVVGYGTADVIAGYNSAGTGGTPVSNTDAMITAAVGLSQPVTRNSTTDNHTFLSADATYYSGTYFSGTIDPLAPANTF